MTPIALFFQADESSEPAIFRAVFRVLVRYILSAGQNYTRFDIGADGIPYLHWIGGDSSALFGTMNLLNGQIGNIGTIGGGLLVGDIAVHTPEPAAAIALVCVGLAGMARRRIR